MKKKTSIHDIAKHLQISATTVSFVLNGKADKMRISEDVKQKVQQYVDKIGYQPNLIAKSLRTGKSKIIGMMVEDISDPFFSSIARGVERRAYKLGYKIFFASTENETEKAKALLKVFRERQVDAYIIAPPPGLQNEVQLLIEDEKPVILFDRYLPGLETHTVIVDNQEGSYKAIKYLQKQGFTKIGFVTLDSDQTQMSDRMDGYLQAIAEEGQIRFVLQVPYAMAEEKIVQKVQQFISMHPNMDAVLFGTNYLALNGLEAIKNLDLQIPHNLAVVSFDDSPLFKLFTPTITAVAQPIEQISAVVVEKIMHMLNQDEQVAIETVVIATNIVERDSAIVQHQRRLHSIQKQT